MVYLLLFIFLHFKMLQLNFLIKGYGECERGHAYKRGTLNPLETHLWTRLDPFIYFTRESPQE